MATRANREWSKAYLCKPQDNIMSHRYSKAKPFIPSYEKNQFQHCPVNMNLLLGWEYARVWEREHNAYIQARKESEKVPTIKRQPYKRMLKKPNKTDCFKRFQTSNAKVSGKSTKAKVLGMVASAGKGRQTGGQGNTLICGYGDIVTANVQPIEENPADEISTCDIDCEATTTKKDVKLMQNEVTQKIPKSYIDPSQYFCGVPVDAIGGGDTCQNIRG